MHIHFKIISCVKESILNDFYEIKIIHIYSSVTTLPNYAVNALFEIEKLMTNILENFALQMK